MFKAIEGIYQNGKICVPPLMSMKDNTRILIIFSDASDKTNDKIETSIEIPVIAQQQSDKLKLDDIDVTVSTKESFYKELLKQDSEKENYSESTFFSSEPIDIGYTDARMLDGIIAEKNVCYDFGIYK